MKRRTFLLAGLAATGAAVFGWSLLPPRQRLHPNAALPLDDDAIALNGYIAIAPDDTVTVFVPKAEMGQGILTTLAMLVAEELGADWTRVRTAPAPIDGIYNNLATVVDGLPFHPDDDGRVKRVAQWMVAKTYRELGTMLTGGSSSVKDMWGPMRDAGAAARETLRAAAARQLDVSVDACTVADGVVRAGDRALGFGAIVARFAADGGSLETAASWTLKAPADFVLLGRDAVRRTDAAAKSDGSARFGLDARPEGVRYAAIAMCPVVGGTLASADLDAARGEPGVIAAVRVPALRGAREGVAIVADAWPRARKALAAAKPAWTEGDGAAFSSAAFIADLRTRAESEDGFPFRRTGDATAAIAGAARTVRATYEAPFLAHTTMEPPNCTVRLGDGEADVWVGTQVPEVARDAAADVLRLAPDRVRLHQLLLGGGFGRRLDVEHVAQAAAIAREVPGTPVQLIWSRENDVRHDHYRPAAACAFAAGLDDAGRVVGFRATVAGPSVLDGWGARTGILGITWGPDRTGAEGVWDQPYDFGAQRVGFAQVDCPVSVGNWRSVGHSHNAFFLESFIDELAHASDADPVAFRLAHLGHHPRAARVLETAAARAGWGTPSAPAPDGAPTARGVALHFSFGSYVAEVATVSRAADGAIRVHTVHAVVDCGFAVHPRGVVQQIESGIVYGLSAALHGAITIEGGRVREGNFDGHPALRFSACPEIDVHIVPSVAPPEGVGEPGLPPIAPAVGNALFALDGERRRALPLRTTRADA